MANAMMYEAVDSVLSKLSDRELRLSTRSLALGAAKIRDDIASGRAALIDASDVYRMFVKPSEGGWVPDYEYFNYAVKVLDHLPPELRSKTPWPNAVIAFRDPGSTGANGVFLCQSIGTSWNPLYAFVHEGRVVLGSLERLRDSYATHFRGEDGTGMSPCDVAEILVRAFSVFRNARWLDESPNRATRRRTPSIAGVRFKTITVDMDAPLSKGEPKFTRSHGVAWHMVRGCIVRYAPGKVTWRRAHERGSREHGIIVQDYSIKAPKVA